MASRVLNFSGVIVSAEEEDGTVALYIYGEVGDREGYFYVKISRERAEKILALGIGQRIEGRGVLVSEEPLVVEAVED